MVMSPISNYWYSCGNTHANCSSSNIHDLKVKSLVIVFNSRMQFGLLVE